jgi:hypothetical protein
MRGGKGKVSKRVAAQRPVWRVGCAMLAAAVSVACVAQDGRPAKSSSAAPAAPIQTGAKATNDGKAQSALSPEDLRKKEITEQSAELLNMAMALKAEVDKTTKDTLSLNVIRKADEIEKLAKVVKEKMKQNSGS